MRIPRKAALLGAAVFVLALPASNAFAGATPTDKKQNTRIAKLSKDLTTLKKTALTLSGTLATKASLDGVDNRLKAIEAATPQIVSGLTALKTGLEQAGAGLTSLQKLVTSTEYGVAQLSVGGTPVPGAFVVTPDIPDAVQQAQASGSFNAGANTGAITISVAVRSAENDGDGTVAAAHCRVTGTDQAGRIVTSSPNAALGGAPFWAINTKSVQTSTDAANAGFPSASRRRVRTRTTS